MDLPLPIRILLWPVSLVYGLCAKCRVLLYRKGVFRVKRLKTPVVSVGNLTVGGTGKTPMVLHLAEKFLADGKRVGILSRGYRGKNGTNDEIEMLKQRLDGRVVFGVGPDRFEEGSRLERENPVDVFLLDDGFQHLQLARDVDIVLWDGTKKFQKQWLLPSGSLREPLSSIARADLLVVTRKTEAAAVQRDGSLGIEAFTAETTLLGFRKINTAAQNTRMESGVEGLVFAFCGVGNPQAFFNDLRRWQVEPSGTMRFRDHHRYTQNDAVKLTEGAHWADADAFVTTEKDEQNLSGIDFGEWPVYVAVTALYVKPEGEFYARVKRLLSERSGAAS